MTSACQHYDITEVDLIDSLRVPNVCLPYLKAILYHAPYILKTDKLLYPIVFNFSELLGSFET